MLAAPIGHARDQAVMPTFAWCGISPRRSCRPVSRTIIKLAWLDARARIGAILRTVHWVARLLPGRLPTAAGAAASGAAAAKTAGRAGGLCAMRSAEPTRSPTSQAPAEE